MPSQSKKNRETEDRDPFDWSQLFGFEQDQRRLADLVRQKTLPQVILFEGREGIGKRTLMAWLIGQLLCRESHSCGSCDHCVGIQAVCHEEVLWLEASTAYKLEDAVALQEHLEVQGSRGFLSRIVVVIDIERMSQRVANRLLKTLEEPGEQALVLMSTSHPQQILPTIRSRAVQWHLSPPSTEQTLPWLKEKLIQDGVISPDQADSQHLIDVIERHGRSPGAALKAFLAELSGEQGQLERQLIQWLRFQVLNEELLNQAHDLSRVKGLSAIDLANHFELLLNRYYKWCLGLGYDSDRELFKGLPSNPSLKGLHHWRGLIRKVRAIAGRGKVPLNAQLMLESLSLPET